MKCVLFLDFFFKTILFGYKISIGAVRNNLYSCENERIKYSFIKIRNQNREIKNKNYKFIIY